jgi:hypothetical protein
MVKFVFSQLIAEIILQLINLSTTGRLAFFATKHGYYHYFAPIPVLEPVFLAPHDAEKAKDGTWRGETDQRDDN